MSDNTTQRARTYNPTKLSAVSFRLTVISGPDVGASATLDASTAGPLLVGTSPACQLRLTDATVSRRHLSLEVDGPRLVVTDLRSNNGTSVGAVGIGTVSLSSDETLTLGNTQLRVDRVTTAQAPELPLRVEFGRYFGASTEMRRLYPLLERLAKAPIATLIEGETGTGKELLAESLHEEGPRAKKPFVVFDCTTVAASLMEAELFGHARGAFSGAHGERPGLVELAHGGTLLIDEIGELAPELQPKLLRLIDRGEVRRVGSNSVQQLDLRVFAATRRDLEAEVQAGRFREDLFHRLAIGRVLLPPLRNRKGDVGLLVQRFLADFGYDANAVPADVLARWEQYSWPGNVRELRNTLLRYVTLGDTMAEPTPTSTDGDFLSELLALDLELPEARRRLTTEFEKRYLARALEKHGGNVTRAARSSGIARRHFQHLKARGDGS